MVDSFRVAHSHWRIWRTWKWTKNITVLKVLLSVVADHSTLLRSVKEDMWVSTRRRLWYPLSLWSRRIWSGLGPPVFQGCKACELNNPLSKIGAAQHHNYLEKEHEGTLVKDLFIRQKRMTRDWGQTWSLRDCRFMKHSMEICKIILLESEITGCISFCCVCAAKRFCIVLLLLSLLDLWT